MGEAADPEILEHARQDDRIRWVGILHGCLRHRTRYDEDIAWGHRNEKTDEAA